MVTIGQNETIAAIATPPGQGGVGMIRISGAEAPKIIEKIWQGGVPVAQFESHRLYYGTLYSCRSDGSCPSESFPLPSLASLGNSGGNDSSGHPSQQEDSLGAGGTRENFLAVTGPALDKCLIVWMKAPHSYTGEDVIEIQAHGSPLLLEKILETVLAAGARLARPGEFTERAFINGKLDLTQAEAVADLIGGQSEEAIELAQNQLSGHLTKAIGKIRQDLVVMRAQCEAMIDFPDDEDVQGLRHEEITERVDRVTETINRWLDGFTEGKQRREGARVVLAGRPNVGKSSLMNALLQEERAIVHEQAGTTRDVISEAIHLKGMLVRLSDTAGLRSGQEEIEVEGIRRSQEQIETADLVLFVIEASDPMNEEDQRYYRMIRGRSHFVIVNKMDLLSDGSCPSVSTAQASLSLLRASAEPKLAEFSSSDQREREGEAPRTLFVEGATQAPNNSPAQLRVSAKTGTGLEELKAALYEQLRPHRSASDTAIIATTRHKVCLEQCLSALAEVRKSAENNSGLELIAADLLIAANHLSEITGEMTNEEILGEIFAKFCLGK